MVAASPRPRQATADGLFLGAGGLEVRDVGHRFALLDRLVGRQFVKRFGGKRVLLGLGRRERLTEHRIEVDFGVVESVPAGGRWRFGRFGLEGVFLELVLHGEGVERVVQVGAGRVWRAGRGRGAERVVHERVVLWFGRGIVEGVGKDVLGPRPGRDAAGGPQGAEGVGDVGREGVSGLALEGVGAFDVKRVAVSVLGVFEGIVVEVQRRLGFVSGRGVGAAADGTVVVAERRAKGVPPGVQSSTLFAQRSEIKLNENEETKLKKGCGFITSVRRRLIKTTN